MWDTEFPVTLRLSCLLQFSNAVYYISQLKLRGRVHQSDDCTDAPVQGINAPFFP